MAVVPNDPDARLRRAALAEALTKAGFPVAYATLATKATRGGGPPFQLFGRVPLYRWGDSLEWVYSRLGPAIRSTSEVDTDPARRAASMPATGGTRTRRRVAGDTR